MKPFSFFSLFFFFFVFLQKHLPSQHDFFVLRFVCLSAISCLFVRLLLSVLFNDLSVCLCWDCSSSSALVKSRYVILSCLAASVCVFYGMNYTVGDLKCVNLGVCNYLVCSPLCRFGCSRGRRSLVGLRQSGR